MAALEALYGDPVAHESFRSLVGPVSEVGGAVNSTGATGAKLAFLLGVEVQKDVTLQYSGLQRVGSGHAGLLIVCDESLKRAVLQSLVLKNGKRESDTDAVVGSEGGPLCGHPLLVYLGLDRIGKEVVLRVSGLLRNHVHVRLHDHTLAVLVAWSGGNCEYDVAGVVLLHVNTVLFSPAQEIFLNLAFVL